MKTLQDLKQAVAKAKKIYVWTPYARMQDGTPLGGYIETYKTQMAQLFKAHVPQYGLKTNFRLDPETGFLFVEPFFLDQAA